MNKLKNFLKRISIIKIAIASALLGAYGGQGQKEYRRIYLPLILMLLALLHLRHWGVIFIMAMTGAFSMGYGIPSPDDPDPSSIGKFWYKWVTILWYRFFTYNFCLQKVEFISNLLTRGTVALMVNLSLLPIPILKGNWFVYLIGCSFIKLVYTLFSWRDLGVIKTKTGHLLISDIIVYGTIGLMASIMIYS